MGRGKPEMTAPMSVAEARATMFGNGSFLFLLWGGADEDRVGKGYERNQRLELFFSC